MVWLDVQQISQSANMSPRQRTDEKAQAILDAARTCLGERGYAGTTIAEIASQASVSRGLLHYYFDSKADLLAQAVRDSSEATLELVEAMFAQSETVDDLAAGLASALRSVVESDPIYRNLSLECWTVARQSPLVARALEDLYSQARDAFREGLTKAAERRVINTQVSLDGLAALFVGITDGLIVQFLISPELASDESIWQAVEMAARALLGGGTS